MLALKAAAIMIQAVVRGRLVRSPASGPTHRAIVTVSIVEQIAALQIQLTWRQRTKPPAVKIQHLWRKYTCQKIFKYYRDLIKFRLTGDPKALLRAINPSEAVEEKVSLSDRFGLWLGFHPCDQAQYLAMIDAYCAAFGVEVEPEVLRAEAIEWQASRGARSGRVAWQFFTDLAGRHGVRI